MCLGPASVGHMHDSHRVLKTCVTRSRSGYEAIQNPQSSDTKTQWVFISHKRLEHGASSTLAETLTARLIEDDFELIFIE